MTEEQIKIRLDSSTYVTKVNGRLVMVRERREKLLDICMDLLGEAFGKYSRPKMRDDSKKPEGENVPVQNPRTTPFQNFPTPPVFNPNANLVGSPPVQAIMGPMGPQPGIYRFGNRQLALLPLNPQGGSAMSPQMGYPYPQPPWMFPQTSNKGSFNFPPMGTDPRQFITNPAPLSEVASQTSVTVTKHVCAECGRLRSRKYQHENPLRPGESPTPSFCKKCQRDVTSTEESDTSVRKTEKSHMRSKKGRKKEIRSESDTESSRESIGSNERQKALSSKQKKTRNKPSDDHLALEQQLEQSSHRHPRTHPHEDEDYIPSRKQPSPLPQTALARHSRSTSSSQEHTGQEYRGDTAAHHSHGGHEAQRSSRESMATDAAEAFHHSRRAPFQSRYETYETDRVSKHSRSNEDSASSETTPRKGHSFEDPMMSNSRTRSEEASRRRRLERSIDRQGYYREATGLPHGIRPSEEDEVVVVTERYVYRPRPLSHVQEEDLKNRKQDIVDKATLRDGKSYQQFAAEAEASSYYHNNWSGVSEQAKSSRERVRPRDLEGLIAPADSHTSETSSSSRYEAANDVPYLPRAPSPQKPLRQGGVFRSQINLPHYDVPYPSSEDEHIPSRRNERCYSTRDQEVATLGRSRKGYKPPYVREATDRGTERALMPSPKPSHERLFYPDTNDSEITEEIDRVERHVTFRDPDGYEESYDILGGKNRSARVLREEERR